MSETEFLIVGEILWAKFFWENLIGIQGKKSDFEKLLGKFLFFFKLNFLGNIQKNIDDFLEFFRKCFDKFIMRLKYTSLFKFKKSLRCLKSFRKAHKI